MKTLIYLFIVAITFSACAKDPEEVAPITANQEFYIYENAPAGALVGKLAAIQKDNKQLLYSILSGNESGAFLIDSLTGILRVNNVEALNFESKSTHLLKVKVSIDQLSFQDEAYIRVDVKDIGIPSDGLVSYFAFNGNTRDSISEKHGVGQLYGFFTDRFGARNRTCELMGFNSYIRLDSAYDFPERTIGLWFNASFIGSEPGYLMCIDNPELENGSVKLIFDDSNKLSMSVGDTNVDTTVQIENWHHIAIVQQVKSIQFYFDGKQIAQKTMNTPELSPLGFSKALLGVDSRLGSVEMFDLFYYSGQIDDLLFYNRALSAEEIALMFIEPNLSAN